ncbi:2-succinyl-6-hydroxy-2,4-cyclohexadiene-1-carboxylic acid synthase/2-oxoglutarate decarboxylase [Rippkaea orientalis PCC 8801]|uniref:2-succinyl-5-enolpyruvyl-6-hydroxy-3-cyclohexene-1-carboxylate synthase n=1 Tax=Rippkaea orientalis (strain PCC 8801 / RF-1) TaxID=41431 RepID=MEND_RIPO1|nr:2-succinyl-5-enolpyruvyl-6-hydroxy-3-cyclohexene-1-carboxylic-acid synthase [Rippkaea orientalis]B7K0T5.1 RecName: Full=2-succinyl-5-enolpyruvyl-6-hydroxy-3-cyclohexene-1-carboxylate synthase; Short=SEPHCHC synthase [Rippkaea orientalis PCC 8801]ACK65076.1 2-succinyl-6-hydroxy-2,4-cyclohexadiene-1-carboxylic acid synthase/2-oxoglutarate decarboxylase [Rippkaea orientalis PCC 8801]
MSLDFRNINTLWSSVIVETLHRLGLTTAIICPGSRSTPLAIAFAEHPHITAIPILDERSAAFFALGIAKRTQTPTAMVCTSGTAGANFYPTVIEARESRVPLLIFTADRPPELRHCRAGQAIDQIKLYGNYPNWQTELAIPAPEMGLFRYLRQTIIHGWERSHFPTAGVVHFNCPFREPLAPIIQPEIKELVTNFENNRFFESVKPLQPNLTVPCLSLPPQWLTKKRGIIIAGVAHPKDPELYCQAIANLATFLNYPVLTEALSPVRNFAHLNPNLITTYDLLLRNKELAQNLTPDLVIQIGDFPTSKELRNWLETLEPDHWIIDPSAENSDPLHNKTTYLRLSIESFKLEQSKCIEEKNNKSSWLKTWQIIDQKIREEINLTLESVDFLLEGKVSWLLSQILPPKTPIFIANSMSVRNAEFFWQPNNHQIIPYCNRGANGIDGTLSTALGMAYQAQSSVMLTGDLALIHDTNGFLINPHFRGHLTIILINNNGGGIFEMLPISDFNPLFEAFFATPQNLDFSQLCQTYKIPYQKIRDWPQIEKLLKPLPKAGIRILEVQTDRKKDAVWLKKMLSELAKRVDFRSEELSEN